MKSLLHWGRRFDLWAVPALLAVVALNQIRLAHTAELSPWKGGGFGMFGSIDDPGQRFVGLEGETADGRRVPLKMTFPGGALSSKVGRRLSCMPDDELVRFVADRMIRMPFVAAGAKRDALLARVQSQNPESPIPGAGAPSDPTVYRMLTRNDPMPDKSQVVILEKLKVQMWRLRFDAETSRVRCERIPIAAEVRAAPRKRQGDDQ